MMRGLRCVVGLLAALALSAGCGEGTAEPENPVITGNWTGISTSFGAVEDWTIQLEESGEGTVTGKFTLRIERLVFSGDVSGTHTYPSVSLDLRMRFFGELVTATYLGQLVCCESITGGYQLFDEPSRTLNLDRLGT